MSNAVDILFVAGPRNGVIYNAPRPAVATYIVSDGAMTTATYYHRAHTYDGKQYHIAVHEGDEPDAIVIDALIVASKITPAWDLNR